MFSEENIERTKEKLVEYVKDNADKFEWKNVYSEGEYSGYWSIPSEQVFSQPIDNAVQVFGIDSAMDIIVETLEKFYNIHNDGESEEPVSIKISDLIDFLDNNEYDEDDDEDYYDDYDEDDYGYDEDYFDYYDSDDDDEDDIPLNQSTNKPKDKNELLMKLKEFDDQISILQSMGFLSHAWKDEDESEDSSEGLILSDVLNIDDVSFKDMDEFKKIIEANVEFENEDEEVSGKEMVNHPPHYNQGKFETIDIIEDIVAGYDDPVEAYLIGTTLKYLARAPFKNAKKQDLEKAEFYLKRAIDKQQ